MARKVLIVDDQKSVREQLKLLIDAEKGFKVIGTAENGTIAIEKAKSFKPEIILLDLDMPVMGGIEASEIINENSPQSKIFIITSIERKEYLKQINHLKVYKVLHKGENSELVDSLRKTTNTKLSKFKAYAGQNYRFTILLSPLLIIILLIGKIIYKPEINNSRANSNTNITNKTIFAPGTLVPEGEIIKLSVANAEDSQINQILVEEGELVTKNQIIATLQGIEQRKQDLEEAQNNLRFQQAKLTQTLIGKEKEADLVVQEAEIDKTLANLRLAQQIYNRKKSLLTQGAVSKADVEESKEHLNLAKANFEGEQQNLTRLTNLKPVEQEIAKIEVESAKIAVKQRKIDLEDTKVRVPVTGQILRINTRVGEQINTQQGIVELGRTNQMYAIAEVYETNINKVQVGQSAIISSESRGFGGEVEGIVEKIGVKVGRKTLGNTLQDPTQDENSRIVEVKIRLSKEDSKKVSNLTHAKVLIAIKEQP